MNRHFPLLVIDILLRENMTPILRDAVKINTNAEQEHVGKLIRLRDPCVGRIWHKEINLTGNVHT